MTRLASALAALLGTALFFSYLHHIGKGPFASLAARHQREMKDRTAVPERLEPMTHEAFYALPRGLTVAEYSGIERRAVSIEGQVHGLLRAMDGDYHAELDPLPDSAGRRPFPSLTTEITPSWHGNGSNGWSYERIAWAFRSGGSGPAEWEGGPARVRISGWLLYDLESDLVPRLVGWPVPKRATDWEIHPVTKIERWDDDALAWVEVKR